MSLDGVLNEVTATEAFAHAAQHLLPYPNSFCGKGIIIPAGGVKYFTCAWVCVHMLRHHGCMLPIELWYLGPSELTPEMRRLIEPLGVTCIDANEIQKIHPARILEGWELKAYAIARSRFREILLIDADNMSVSDPSYLFDAKEYHDHGAVFWPDFGRLKPDNPLWQLADIPYRSEPEFETGQILINKERCWSPLLLTMWINDFSDFWYPFTKGDKETFHIAWRKLDLSYAMPPTRIFPLNGVMCQHDFEGRRIFQHRNMSKWSLHWTPHIEGFLQEDKCISFIDELREIWSPQPGYATALSAEDEVVVQQVAGRRFLYTRVGYDARPISFCQDGLIGEGNAGCEVLWWIEKGELVIADNRGLVTCRLHRIGVGIWEGQWSNFERMPIRLEPFAQLSDHQI